MCVKPDNHQEKCRAALEVLSEFVSIGKRFDWEKSTRLEINRLLKQNISSSVVVG